MSEGRGPRRDFRALRLAASTTTIGLTLALSIGIGIWLGIWIDGKFKTHGIAVIIGALVGIGAGFKQLIQAVIRAGREQERIDAEERERKD